MRFDEILSGIGHVVDKLHDLGLPGTDIAETVVHGAQGLASAFDHFKAANGGAAPPEAQASRDQKLQKVLDHAKSVADKLDPGGAQ